MNARVNKLNRFMIVAMILISVFMIISPEQAEAKRKAKKPKKPAKASVKVIREKLAKNDVVFKVKLKARHAKKFKVWVKTGNKVKTFNTKKRTIKVRVPYRSKMTIKARGINKKRNGKWSKKNTQVTKSNIPTKLAWRFAGDIKVGKKTQIIINTGNVYSEFSLKGVAVESLDESAATIDKKGGKYYAVGVSDKKASIDVSAETVNGYVNVTKEKTVQDPDKSKKPGNAGVKLSDVNKKVTLNESLDTVKSKFGEPSEILMSEWINVKWYVYNALPKKDIYTLTKVQDPSIDWNNLMFIGIDTNKKTVQALYTTAGNWEYFEKQGDTEKVIVKAAESRKHNTDTKRPVELSELGAEYGIGEADSDNHLANNPYFGIYVFNKNLDRNMVASEKLLKDMEVLRFYTSNGIRAHFNYHSYLGVNNRKMMTRSILCDTAAELSTDKNVADGTFMHVSIPFSKAMEIHGIDPKAKGDIGTATQSNRVALNNGNSIDNLSGGSIVKINNVAGYINEASNNKSIDGHRGYLLSTDNIRYGVSMKARSETCHSVMCTDYYSWQRDTEKVAKAFI